MKLLFMNWILTMWLFVKFCRNSTYIFPYSSSVTICALIFCWHDWTNIYVRYVATELATDIVINIGDVKFYQHKVWTYINLSSCKGYSALISIRDVIDYIFNSHIFVVQWANLFLHQPEIVKQIVCLYKFIW